VAARLTYKPMTLDEKRRILIFRHDLLPWSETFILSQAENLRHFVPVYCGLRRVNGLNPDAERTIVIKERSLRGWIRGQTFRAFRWAHALVPQLRRLNVCLVHAHFEGGGMSAVRLARALKIPLIVTCHGIDVTKHERFQWPNPAVRMLWLRRRAELQCHGTLFLGVSSFIRDRMLGLGYPAERTEVHYTGVDVAALASDSCVERQPIVLFAARLVEKKGCRFVLEAMQRVQASVPELELVIIGDGPLREELECEAHSRCINAKFLGRCTKETTCAWMSRSRLLCAPFLPAKNGDTDGCPTIILEALAIGLPVVAFAHGGSIEALGGGAAGILVPTGDAKALAFSILQLHHDSALWSQLSLAGRRLVEEQFDLQRQNARLEELYHRVLHRQVCGVE
jgi:colanic acid/amylovoran biosynthesis glycosyltransferase